MSNIVRCLTQLMESLDFSDLKLTCKGREFKVHKAIICSQSAVIKAAVLGGFEESHTGIVNMDAFHPGSVKRMVQFMYTGNYDLTDEVGDSPTSRNASPSPDDETECGGPSPDRQSEADASEEESSEAGGEKGSKTIALVKHAHVNSIGDYYQVDELVSLANTKILQLTGSGVHPESLLTIIEVATGDKEMEVVTGDKEIVGILAAAVAADVSKYVDHDRFKSLDVMTDFAIHVLRGCASQIRDFKCEILAFKQRLDQEKHRVEMLESSSSSMTKCLDVLRKTSACRNITCNAEFLCTIEPHECILRCSRCNCRHLG